METHLFSVYDSAAHCFLEPFNAPSQEFAIREFRRATNDPGHQFNTFPDDYTLFYVGSFDPESGTITPLVPVSLGVAITFLSKPQLVSEEESSLG